jgi:hypothetical protein
MGPPWHGCSCSWPHACLQTPPWMVVVSTCTSCMCVSLFLFDTAQLINLMPLRLVIRTQRLALLHDQMRLPSLDSPPPSHSSTAMLPGTFTIPPLTIVHLLYKKMDTNAALCVRSHSQLTRAATRHHAPQHPASITSLHTQGVIGSLTTYAEIPSATA